MKRHSVRVCSVSEEVTSVREPAVVKGTQLGEAPSLWKNVSYLAKKCAGREVRVHRSSTPHMDFITKNFSYMYIRLCVCCLHRSPAHPYHILLQDTTI